MLRLPHSMGRMNEIPFMSSLDPGNFFPSAPRSYLLTLNSIIMDDPKKKGADGKRRSQQTHELAYQKRKAAKKKAAKKKTAKKAAPKKKAAKKKAAKKKSATKRR